MRTDQTPRRTLEGIHVFAGLKPATVEALARSCRELRAPRGQVILREGTPGGRMYLIARGRVAVVKGLGSRREVTLAELEAGEFFGEMCIIEARRRSASIRAVEPVLLYALTRGDLLRVFQRWPSDYAVLVFNIARHLCRRLRRMDEVFASTAF